MSILSSRNWATRYEFTIPDVVANDDDAPDGDVVHLDVKNGKSKRMVTE